MLMPIAFEKVRFPLLLKLIWKKLEMGLSLFILNLWHHRLIVMNEQPPQKAFLLKKEVIFSHVHKDKSL